MKLDCFAKISTRSGVDKDKGIIFGVSAIAVGPAAGHDLVIDSTTLKQVKELASQFNDGLKVRMNHPKYGQDAPVQSIIGSLKNFRVDGSSVRADLHLLKSDENYDKIIEMSEKMPENFGLSIVFSGKPEQDDDMRLARVTEIYSCDLVDDPAANPTGLFSKRAFATCDNCGKSAHLCQCSTMDKLKGAAKKHGISIDDQYKNSKPMNEEQKALAVALGLKDDATSEDLIRALAKKCMADDQKETERTTKHAMTDIDEEDDAKTPKKVKKQKKDEDYETDSDMSSLRDQIAALSSRLDDRDAGEKQQLCRHQKEQIDTMLSEAATAGKVVPYDLEDLYSEKDGKLTIVVKPEALSKVISKLPEGQIKTNLRQPSKLKDDKGGEVQVFGLGKTRKGNEKTLEKLTELNRQRNETNKVRIGTMFKAAWTRN